MNNKSVASVWSTILRLIEMSYSTKEAAAFAEFQPSEIEKTALIGVGKSILADCRPLAGSCMLMNALFAVRLRQATGAPTHVLAGGLSVAGDPIFGHRDANTASQSFDVSDPSWDGHAWLMFGPLIADASLLRTARSPAAHPVLRMHVRRQFGERAALLIDHYEDIAELELQFVPRHVLTNEEIDKLASGARLIFNTM
jgi:hypothetical protein